ncbi:MAG: phosphomannomutase, partial [Pseudomonadota bacterium]
MLLRDVIARSDAAFGTSGVRGLVEALDDATVFAYTAAFLAHVKPEDGSRIWVGHDLRPSSPRIAQAVLAAISEAGLKSVFAGEVPTPALAHAALSAGEPCVMVTGSHIPFDRNGIKFYRADGEMTKSDETPIIESETPFPKHLFNGNELLEHLSVEPDAGAVSRLWTQRFIAAFPGLLDGWRVGHFQHSAAGRDLLAAIFEALGATVIPLARSETFVPVDTEAVSAETTAQAKTWAQKHDFDALISTDGDGDRPLLADETGSYFRGDALGILAAKALGVRTIVTPVSSTSAVEASGYFAKTIRTKIGSPHVIAAMAGEDGVAGFEANGGFLTGSPLEGQSSSLSPLPTRDAVLPILATIWLARRSNMRLSQLSSLLPERTTASDRLEHVPRDRSLALIAALEANL